MLGIANVYLTLSEMSLIDGKYQESIQNLIKLWKYTMSRTLSPKLVPI